MNFPYVQPCVRIILEVTSLGDALLGGAARLEALEAAPGLAQQVGRLVLERGEQGVAGAGGVAPRVAAALVPVVQRRPVDEAEAAPVVDALHARLVGQHAREEGVVDAHVRRRLFRRRFWSAWLRPVGCRFTYT